jgi:hypothetical protein
MPRLRLIQLSHPFVEEIIRNGVDDGLLDDDILENIITSFASRLKMTEQMVIMNAVERNILDY